MLGGHFKRLIKTPQPKAFSFKPRYYNELQERVEMQKARVLREIELEKMMEENPELKLREEMRLKWNTTTRKQQLKQSNRRILFIAGILSIAAYYVFLK